MDSNKNFYGQSMDEIVFDNRNKGYGAFQLRSIYQKTLMKALIISVSVFVLGLYSPKVANQLGLFEADAQDSIINDTITLIEPPSIKKDEVEPPPPPPEPEIKIERASERFVEMVAVKKEEAKDEPPKQEDLKDKDISDKKVDGTNKDDGPPLPPGNPGGSGLDGDKDKIFIDVDVDPEFKGGKAALKAFLDDNLQYPEAEYTNGIQGKAEVFFVVNSDGTIENVKIEKSSGSTGLDAEAVRVVRKTNGRFNPAKRGGKSVRSYGRIPIIFEIEEE